MNVKQQQDALRHTLDYILNEATIRDIDALEAAVQRRRRDLMAETGIISLNPDRAAKEMTDAVHSSIEASMSGIRGTFRKFAEDVIRKEAPELTDAQMDELVDSWIPQEGGNTENLRKGRYESLVRNGMVGGIPSDALFEMVCQFVAFSSGRMSAKDDSQLRESLGDWPKLYWKRFPEELQAVIRDFLESRTTEQELQASLALLF